MTGRNVTVVIPCRDVDAFVSDALDSLLSESERIAAVVCVDDSSIDSTMSVIESAAAAHELPIRVLESPRRGACAARNAGLELVETEFCQFLDADDLVKPRKILRQVDLLKSSQADVATAPYHLQSVTGELRRIGTVSDPWPGLITSELGCTSSMLFRTDAVRSVDGWSEDLQSSQEYDLLFRLLARRDHLAIDDEPLTIKRERVGAISSGDSIERLETFIDLRLSIGQLLDDRDALSDDLYMLLNETIFRRIQRVGYSDASLAQRLFDKRIPDGFEPGGSTTRARLYRTVFNLVGFGTAESLRRCLERN